jgi:hypothetical protein
LEADLPGTKRGRAARPLGVTLLALGCFLSAAWSFAAAALPSLFFGALIPLYPPLMAFRWEMVEGRSQLLAAPLDPRGQALAMLVVGVVTLLLGVLLWNVVRYSHLAFIAALWLGAGYYLLSIYRNRPLWLIAQRLLGEMSGPIKLLIGGNLLALLAALGLVTVYLWRRRYAFR